MYGGGGMNLNREELKCLRHIIANNGAGQLRSKRQRDVCISLWRKGLLERRVGDFEWIWNGKEYT